MKSLKRLCIDVCYDQGFNTHLWPYDVIEEVKKEKFAKVITYNESTENYDDYIGWMNGINYINQRKSYIINNIRVWLNRKNYSSGQCVRVYKQEYKSILHYNSDIYGLFSTPKI